MKKLLLLLIAVVALGEAAADEIPAGFRPLETPTTVRPDYQVIADGVKIPDELKFFNPKNSTPSRSSEIIFYNQPEGELKTYYRSGGAMFFLNLFVDIQLVIGPQDGKAYVVYGDDGKVYLRNPVYGLETGAWVEGRLSEDGTQIIVPMGQTIYEQDGYTLDLCWASTEYGGPDYYNYYPIDFTVDDSIDEAVYTIDGDCLILENTAGDLEAGFPDNATIYGLSAVWSNDITHWNMCIDFGSVYTERPFDPWPVIEAQPEGELVDYLRSGEYLLNGVYGPSMDVQFGKAYCVFGDDGKVYIMDPIICGDYQRYRPHPNVSTVCWVEGTLSEDGTTVTVPMGQGLGWDEENDVAYVLANVTILVDEDGQIYYHINEDVTEMTYTIDGNKLILNGTDGDMNAEWPMQITGLAECRMYPRYDYEKAFTGNMEWNTVWHKIVRTPVVPANPSLDPADLYGQDAWYDCGNESGGSQFNHYIKLEDVDGNPIDEQYVTYSIFTDDDQLFTFEADTYLYDLTEDVTEIPYNTQGKALMPRYTKFYRTNAEGYDPFFNWRIGIQVYYTVEGVRKASNIVYYEVFDHDTNVNEVAECKTVVGVKYYNMAGQEMREANGICIAVITYTDGSTSTIKLMK
ncbi:MAG: hypothetical protein IKW97_02945 [Muribaculaceae bacterium]|nr:hypothetical protein [Muribaculaceae bacterium]